MSVFLWSVCCGASLDKPWFVVTKDGEWRAVSKQPRLFRSKTGNKKPSAFRRQGRLCRLENTDLGVALLAFLGFATEAKRSKVFKKPYFRTLFGYSLTDEGWSVLRSKRIEWNGAAFLKIFEAKQPSESLWLLVRIPVKPATQSGESGHPVGAKRRWGFHDVSGGRFESM